MDRFERIRIVNDIGFLTWTPDEHARPKPLSAIAGADEILRFLSKSCKGTEEDLDAQGLPPILQPSAAHVARSVTDSCCPCDFSLAHGMQQQRKSSQFPFSVPKIVSICAAREMECDIEHLDFVFGGSTLNFLATAEPLSDWERQNGPSRFACEVLCLPGHKSGEGIVLISKMNDYTADYNDPGFQFERALGASRGRGANSERAFREACNERMGLDKHEHLQLMEIGRYRVLVSADSDAVEAPRPRGAGVTPVEIKCGNPRNFGMKVMWQMLSNGSQTLILANKRGRVNERQTLLAAESRTFREMVEEHGVPAIRRAEGNVEAAIEKIRAWRRGGELEAGRVYEVVFVGRGVESGMALKPLAGHEAQTLSQLPPREVLEQLRLSN